MKNSPFSGAVPLNLQKNPPKVESSYQDASPSYRNGIVHPETYNVPKDRFNGNNPIRRYPNGHLDVKYVGQQVVDVIHKLQHQGTLNNYEKAMLTIVLPDKFHLVDEGIAKTMVRMTDSERAMVAIFVLQHMKEEENYNAGLGGGSIEGRSRSVV